ncbi:uncharacterized protein [Asterias amurensis]|uniref:uncharacterized protein isoform X2 n=1 Tax=Asterias amurensis TaxID=7602 RepID=UPI003AB88BA5
MASNNNSLKVSHSWKEQSCHFTWNLSAGVLTDFEKVTRNIDNDLEATPDLLQVDQLLFRAYLEVSDNRLCWDVTKAREFLDKADEYIKNHTGPELQPGYRRVALLNRVWIEHKSHRTEEVAELLSELDDLRWCDIDKLVVETLLANALTRLGPPMITRSLQIYEEALKHFPDNVGFLYGAMLMTGRKMRSQRAIGSMYEQLDEDGKKLMDQEKEYCEKLIKVNDKYQLGKASLGLNLSRRGETAEALKLLKSAHKKAPDVTSVFHNLMKCYRYSARAKKDIPLAELRKKINQRKCLDVPESHNQLALCIFHWNKFSKSKAQKKKRRTEALEELNKCLAINKMHTTASLRKAEELAFQKEHDEAKRMYEDMLQKSEHYLPHDKLRLYFEFAKFLKSNGSPSTVMWQKVMDVITSSFEYMDDNSCKWEVRAQANNERRAAYKYLSNHYTEDQEDGGLRLGIVHFQNLDFEEAVRSLKLLDPTTNLEIPCYLAEAYLKWGREQEMSNESTVHAREYFDEARRNVLSARELGLNQIRSRKLLSDTALAIAHSHLHMHQSVIPIESDCVKSYREAVRCGSLVASVEVLRLIEKEFLQNTPRSEFLQTLAEIDICCSQRATDCLHRDVKPRSFAKGLESRDTDIDTFALDCKKIKRTILTTLNENSFFRQAWVQHFAMEKKVLEERFQNNEGELELDGRGESSTRSVSMEEMYAAIDCCEKLRPLLDHIIVKFEKDELDIQEERKKHYFPLVFGEEDSVRTEEVLREKLQSYFEINFEEHYPNLFKNLLQVQPGYNSQNAFLETLYTLVNHVKHSGIHTQDILEIVQDPVKLARQCTDKVEEISNFFFDAMKDSLDLRKEVEELVTELKDSGQASSRQEMEETCKKADELLAILAEHKDFIVRMGSTLKLLEMLAVIRQRVHSDRFEAVNKIAEGTWGMSKNLRKSHLELEVSLLQNADPRAQEVREKCRDTCMEADTLLNEVMKKKRGGPQDDAEVQFPFLDKHPGSDTSPWKGKVKKYIKRYLNENKINPTDELLKVLLQAQPCSSEDNYNFLLMREFLENCKDDSGYIPSEVSKDTENNECIVLDAVYLTRWCTHNAEKIAAQVLLAT